MWKLNNMLPNNQQLTEKIKEGIKKYLETNENENRMIQNLWDAVKEALKEKFIAIKPYIRKQEKSQINLTPKGARERTNKTQNQQKERNHKDQNRNQ